MRSSPLGMLAAGLALAGFACVSAPVPSCSVAEGSKPAITAECRARPESQEYMRRAVERFSGRLETSWPRQTHPGRLDVSVVYAADASVQSVCLRESQGEVVKQRAHRAVDALPGSGRAPACFGDHRIEIQWESALVTEAELNAVLRRCGASSRSRRQPLIDCQHGCTIEQKLRLSDADEQVFECMIRHLPLAFSWKGGDRLVTFLPRESTTPTPDKAYAATEQCSDLADRETLIACMRANGWREVDWHRERHVLLE